MSSRTVQLLLLAALLTLTGCAALQPHPASGDLQTLLAEQEYGRALEVLASQPDLPAAERKTQEQHIRELIDAYGTKIIAAARAKADAGDWLAAQQMLDTAVAKAPSSAALQQEAARVDRERNERLALNRTHQDLARARYLLAATDLYRERAGLEPVGLADRITALARERELASLATRLLASGSTALTRNDLALAGNCLQTAQRIKDDDAVRTELARWQTAQQHDAKLKQARRQHTEEQTRHQERKELLDDLHQSLEQGDLVGARTRLEQLRALQGDTPELAQLGTAVDTAISAQVDELLHQGSELYRDGKIQQAHDVWVQALALDPDNTEARTRIDRAERVLESLQHLRRKPTATAPPPAVSPAPGATAH